VRVIRRIPEERGQTLPLFALLIVTFIALVGLAIDAGRLYIARAELSRALDSAALAGVIELPDEDLAEQRALAYMEDNQPDADVEFPTQQPNQFKVRGTRNVKFFFMPILGIREMDISVQAAAGVGTIPSDTVLLVDATGSMGASPCNSSHNNSGCPIWEAKQAAKGFVDLFLPDSTGKTKVGYAAYRGCHNPPRNYAACVTNSMRVDLTGSATSLHTTINNTAALGGTGTNTCLALYKAQEMFNGPNAQTAPNTLKSIVLLADGDNTYNVNAYNSSQGSPPLACRPASNFTTSQTYTGTGCSASGQGSASSSNPGSSSENQERSLDTKTYQLAQTLKQQGIEIYIVAFGVCGNANNTTPSASYCNNIGNSDPDTVADQRLLKCMASSTPGTNDHYFRVPTASDLPAVFQDIANAIAFRLIE
jgi:Flp pilus assembly protein TadG